MRPENAKLSTKAKVLWIAIIIPFLFMEFPGVFFFQHMTTPYIFGFPFIYGWILIWWAVLCVVIGIAYFSNWGEPVKDPAKLGKAGDK